MAEPSYIDYEAFLDPEFSPASFANSLVVATNNATDTPLDLSTPLSRVLFDLQEIDTHIHTLTSKSALPLLTHTRNQTAAAGRILQETEEQVSSVTQGYERLQKEVIRKWEAADETRVAAEKSLATVRLARAVARCLTLSRQLEGQLSEISGRGASTGATAGSSDGMASSPGPGRDDYRTLERAASTLVSLHRMFSATGAGEEGHGLERVKVIRTLRNDLVIPAENMVRGRAQQAIHRFSMSTISANGSGSQTKSGYKQARDARARLVSAVTILYILSPVPRNINASPDFQPELLLSTLQGYMHTAITSSLNGLVRALSTLPTLERTLSEISGKCQDIFTLEAILSNLRRPVHPLFPAAAPGGGGGGDQSESQSQVPNKSNLLQPLLDALDTSSLPSYFWRSLASSLAMRVQEIIARGGVSARTLRSNKDRLKREVRECVLRGSQLPASVQGIERRVGSEDRNWEREAAVMVSAVVNVLER